MKVYRPTWEPRPDQLEAVKWSIAREACGIFAKPGNGKTAISFYTLRHLMMQNEAKRALIVVPLRPLYSTWPAENRKWDFGFDMGDHPARIEEGQGRHRAQLSMNDEWKQRLLDAQRKPKSDSFRKNLSQKKKEWWAALSPEQKEAHKQKAKHGRSKHIYGS